MSRSCPAAEREHVHEPEVLLLEAELASYFAASGFTQVAIDDLDEPVREVRARDELAIPRYAAGASGSSQVVIDEDDEPLRELRASDELAIPWFASVEISDRSINDDLQVSVIIFDSQLEEPV